MLRVLEPDPFLVVVLWVLEPDPFLVVVLLMKVGHLSTAASLALEPDALLMVVLLRRVDPLSTVASLALEPDLPSTGIFLRKIPDSTLIAISLLAMKTGLPSEFVLSPEMILEPFLKLVSLKTKVQFR